MKRILSIFLGLFLHTWLLADITAPLTQLASDDYNSRTEARNELLTLLSNATAPSKESDQLPGMLAEITAATQTDLPLPSRLYLIHTLGLFGSDSSVDPLVALLDDSSPHVRDAATQALAQVDTERAVSALIQRMDKASKTERKGLLLALSASKSEAAATAIERLLQNADPDVKNLAATALGKLNAEKALPKLWELRNSAPADQRLVFESAILDIGSNTTMAKELIENGSTDSIRIAAFSQLIDLEQSAAANFLESILGSEDLPARAGFIASAAHSNKPELQDLLTNNIEKLSAGDRVIVIGAIEDTRASRYEDVLLSLLNDESMAVRLATIDALGWIGSDKSFEALYAQYSADRTNDMVRDALTRLNSATIDQLLIHVLENSSDPAEMIAAVELTALRDTPGAIDLITSIAGNATADLNLRKACLQALETMGNMESVKFMLGMIREESSMTRPAQTSLKRLSQKLGDPGKQWEQAYQPAIDAASMDDEISNIILILDAVPTRKTLDYMFSAYSNPQLKKAVLSTLPRWTDYHVALTWLQIANSDSSTADDKENALAGIQRAFTHDSMVGDIRTKSQVAKEAVMKAKNAEQKLLVLNAFRDGGFSKKEKAIVSKELESLKSDPDVSTIVTEMITIR